VLSLLQWGKGAIGAYANVVVATRNAAGQPLLLLHKLNYFAQTALSFCNLLSVRYTDALAMTGQGNVAVATLRGPSGYTHRWVGVGASQGTAMRRDGTTTQFSDCSISKDYGLAGPCQITQASDAGISPSQQFVLQSAANLGWPMDANARPVVVADELGLGADQVVLVYAEPSGPLAVRKFPAK
jgi:hypothetical protein